MAAAGDRRSRWWLRPDVLIADEPVASRDASARGEILAPRLWRREERGWPSSSPRTTLAVVWQAADRIAVLNAGRLVEEGTVEHLLCEPAHPYTRRLPAVGQPRSSRSL